MWIYVSQEKRGRSYIDSLDLIKNKKAAKNIFNDGDKSFQYPITGISNNKEIGKHQERI